LISPQRKYLSCVAMHVLSTVAPNMTPVPYTQVKVLSASGGSSVSAAATQVAEERAKRAESEASAARIAAAAAAKSLQAAEIARLEMTSLLAEARRHDEETADLLRHAEADKQVLAKRLSVLQGELTKERSRADALSQELLGLQLQVRSGFGLSRGCEMSDLHV
jgi:chromosome segregation ATPase